MVQINYRAIMRVMKYFIVELGNLTFVIVIVARQPGLKTDNLVLLPQDQLFSLQEEYITYLMYEYLFMYTYAYTITANRDT